MAVVRMVMESAAGHCLLARRANHGDTGGDLEKLASRFIASMPAGNDAPFLHLLRASGDAEDRGG